MIRQFLIILLLLLPVVPLRADCNATATASTTKFAFGSEVVLELRLEADQPTNVFFPDLRDSISKFEIRSASGTITKSVGDTVIYSRVYSLIAFDTGSFIIPQITIMYERKGFATLFPAQTAPIEVHSFAPVIDTNADIADIKPLPKDSTSESDADNFLFFPIASCCAVLLLLFLLVAMKRHRKHSPSKPAFDSFGQASTTECFVAIEELLIGKRISTAKAVLELWALLADQIIKSPTRDESKFISELVEKVKFAAYDPKIEEVEAAIICAYSLAKKEFGA